MTRRVAWGVLAVALTAVGCKTLDSVTQIGTGIGAATGVISADEAEGINRTVSAAGKAFEEITPEQEYYIGRAVAASIMDNEAPYDDPGATEYVNVLGQTLALYSDKPETFGGYHFLIMDSDDVNAFAAPGGLIMVSRGLLRCCRSEAAVAAVLAHEIGHVQHNHGLQAIKKSRLTSALTILAAESAKNLGGEELAKVTRAFEGSISDITATLVNSGYSRSFEREADRAAVAILQRVGYNPRGLADMLAQMDERMKPDELGFAKTHPDPEDRIEDIETLLAQYGPVDEPAARTARFRKALGGI